VLVPANLTPQYKEAEQRFREAASHDDKLAALREMMALLPKHKGTEKLQADLRRRLAKLEEEGEHARKRGQRFDPGHVPHEGAGQWALVGPPNAGKSALLRSRTPRWPPIRTPPACRSPA
jgi:ribosome-interacting GTPase 1